MPAKPIKAGSAALEIMNPYQTRLVATVTQT
jgi:hypothetical protein